MLGDFLKNGNFAGVKRQLGTPPSMSSICDHWSIEWNKSAGPAQLAIAPLTGTEPSGGVNLLIIESTSWVRIWQQVTLEQLELERKVRLTLRARRSPEHVTVPTLEWIALLRLNAQGKRIFARKIFDGPRIFDDEWSDITASLELNGLASNTAYYLALQFAGEAGSVDLASVSLNQDPSPNQKSLIEVTIHSKVSNEYPPETITRNTTITALNKKKVIIANKVAKSSKFLNEPTVPVEEKLRFQDDTLLGWIESSKDNSEVHIVVDGRIMATVAPFGLPVEQARGRAELLSSGFAWKPPAKLLDGADHMVSLRNTANGWPVYKSVLRFPLALELVAKITNTERTELCALGSIPAKPQLPVDFCKNQSSVREVQAEATSAASATKEGRQRLRTCVVSWDMSHNPVGRAFLLADMAAQLHEVELLGPIFSKYGDRIWPPIAGSSMRMRSFPATDMRSFLEGAKAIADTVTCDVVHVGKARLPSLLLGALIKQKNKCPMVLDIDDHELSFFAKNTPVSFEELTASAAAGMPDLDIPYSEIWTRYSETLVAEADAVTVSNYALQERFGGIVVRHGRDEKFFNPALHDRKLIRAAFGYGDQDRVVLFLGTPRSHKGVFTIADAMERIGDNRLAFCVIGSINDKRVSSKFSSYKRARISLHPDQPWERLPELVSMADVVFLLQDPASPVSEYQIPAKLTDALALGVSVFATPVAPMADLITAKALSPVRDDTELDAALRRLAAEGTSQQQARRARDYYLSELSYAVNAARLDLSFRSAAAARREEVPAFDRLFEFLENQTGVALPRFAARPRAPAVWRKNPPDAVFFWKQNDSDIYGRRPDMMAKYLVRSGKVRRVIHFDAPVSSADLDKHAQHGSDAFAHQGNLVYINTMKRVLRTADTSHLIRRTFIHRTGQQPERFFGTDLPPKSAYPDFLRSTLAEAGVSGAPLLWVCPVVFDYLEIKSVVHPGYVVADIIDDQRRWQAKEAYKTRIVQAYDTILRDADLAVANCEAVQKGFSDIRSDILVVPNGAEIFDWKENWPVPDELARMPRPIIGYVGNLRDRVDLDLIRKIAAQHPNGSVVLIGSAHDRPEVLALREIPNIHLLGVRPYADAVRFIRAFDVAIMPHLKNELSESMNPLKLYVYFALGVPIVTTEVANIGDVGPFVGVAATHGDFLAELTRSLAGGQRGISEAERRALLQSVSWETRVASITASMGL